MIRLRYGLDEYDMRLRSGGADERLPKMTNNTIGHGKLTSFAKALLNIFAARFQPLSDP